MAAGDIRKRLFTAVAANGEPDQMNWSAISIPSKLNDIDPAMFIGAYCKVIPGPSRLPETYMDWHFETQLMDGIWQGFGSSYQRSGYDMECLTIVTAGLWRLVGVNLVQGDSAEATIYYRA